MAREPNDNGTNLNSDPVLLLDGYLDQAVACGATDLHFEPFADEILVRIRLDGVLQTLGHIPKPLAENVIGRLMVLGGLLTYRTDIPQEGRIKTQNAGTLNGPESLPQWNQLNLGLRLATFPTVEGTRAVVRILRGKEEFASLESLGYPAECLKTLDELTRRRSGLILLTGPAGSGKTTTIYTFLRTILNQQPGISVISLEDPVEHRLDRVTQIQINPHGEMNYQRALRSLLRQDPQVLALGEIRDAETADICIEAALSGHLLISTIHSGTVAGAIVRLLEMGIPAYQLTSSIEAILAQRLVRKLCLECRQKTNDPLRPYRPVGCNACGQTGYHGRTVIAELGLMTGAFRSAVRRQVDRDEMDQALAADAMLGLVEQARRLTASGVTSVEEISTVLGRPTQELLAQWSNSTGKDYRHG
jgi:type II secretory ATPase GspE/PulE/Tfp pilus assembly ATPase PilB-like protein